MTSFKVGDIVLVKENMYPRQAQYSSKQKQAICRSTLKLQWNTSVGSPVGDITTVISSFDEIVVLVDSNGQVFSCYNDGNDRIERL